MKIFLGKYAGMWCFAIDKTMSQLNSSDYIYSIMQFIGSYDTAKLTKTFTPAVKESVNLEAQAEKLTNWFRVI